jgi:hypothetical protein
MTVPQFGFGINFSFGEDSIFTDNYNEFSDVNPPPPVVGYFLELQGDPFELLSGQNMTLL